MARRAVFRALIALPILLATPLFAQQQPPTATELGAVLSPILTIDTERVFTESAFGRRVAQDVETKGAALSAENRQIEADLAAEEEELTERRPTMAPDEFRVLADAFDQKVQSIRQAQSAKGRALNQLLDKERETFLSAAGPVLEELMREAEAAVILERRSVFVSSNAIDITDEAISKLDQRLGSGGK